jgi:hypothetical protein
MVHERAPRCLGNTHTLGPVGLGYGPDAVVEDLWIREVLLDRVDGIEDL